MPKLNCSIVLFNNSIYQVENIIKCILNTTFEVKIYLIDNSKISLYKDLITTDKRITYIHNRINMGYGKAHNIAIRKSISDGVPYHLVINPDVSFKKGTLEAIYGFMEGNPDIGLLMPKILYPDGSLQYVCKMIPTPLDLFERRFLNFGHLRKIIEARNNRFELRFADYNDLMNAPFLSGCFMFLRTSALKEIGLFDERFFMYADDTDLSRRIHERYKTMYYPEVSIIHDHARESYRNRKMLIIHIINVIRYFDKWGWIRDKKRKFYNAKLLEELRHNQIYR